MILEDSLWLKKVTSYNSSGVSQLFERYYIPLVLFAKSYIQDEETAKDVVQDIFCLLLEKREKFHSIDNLKIYLYNAVRNKCLKHLRHEGVKGRYQQYIQHSEKEEENYQERILEEEVFLLLNETILGLPEQCKKVFLLTLEGKGNAEIAHILGISIETVKSHKKTGKKMLYDKLKDTMPMILLIFYLFYLKK